jgi:hypothetical protein
MCSSLTDCDSIKRLPPSQNHEKSISCFTKLSFCPFAPLGLNRPVRPDELIPGIEAPSNAIELQLQPTYLASLVELKEVEAFDRVLLGADTRELPVPDDVSAAGGIGEDLSSNQYVAAGRAEERASPDNLRRD